MKKLLLFVLLHLVLITASYAQNKPQAVIIFDASGSMWGQIDGKAKISIAKEALNSVVKEWNPEVELGLTAYGHRKKGDCNDIESIVPVGAVNKDKIISIVQKIQPKGKTPIARSLKKVAEELKYTEEKATIILISDGKESCDANPCNVAKELEKYGIDFVTHVIGFNVDKKTDKELECIAKSTGGEYFSAKNAIALNDAMKTIVKKVEKVEPTPKKLKNNLEISASEKKDGQWIDAIHYIYNLVDGKKAEQFTNCYSKKKKPCLETLPSGKYILVSEYNEFTKETPIEINSEELVKLNIVMGGTGRIEISASEKEGGQWIEAIHYIYNSADKNKEVQITNCWSKSEKSCLEKLPVGNYIMLTEYNEYKKETPIEIKYDELIKINVVMGETGKLEITATKKGSDKWVEAIHYIYNEADEKQEVQITNCWSEETSCIIKIPVGKYLMLSEYDEYKKETPIEIKGNEETKVQIVFE